MTNYTYEISRNKFRNCAKMYNADVLDSLIINDEDDLTIDIAVFKRDPKSLILHISGTHGVEGFIGSEIQIEIMKNIPSKSPTIIFIHGLNPFGMKYFRRVNENNVDLNRNALFNSEFKDKVDLYKNVTNYINPTYPLNDTIYTRIYRLYNIAKSIITNGFTNSKRAMVTGTYNPNNSKCLFYCGNELQKSHKILKNYLEQNGYTKMVEDLCLMDVHSGMGKMGKDTVMIASSNTMDKDYLDDLFSESYSVCYTHKDGTNNVTKGYEYTRGDVADNYPTLFRNAKKVIAVTQEFGTYHNIWVALELILENQAWNYGSVNYDNRKLYNIFSPLRDENIKNQIIKRGINTFNIIVSNYINKM